MADTELFAELDSLSGGVTPSQLTGHERELWNEFIAQLRVGRWASIPKVRLFTVVQKKLGLSCSLSTFRAAIHRALLEQPDDGESKETKRPRAGTRSGR